MGDRAICSACGLLMSWAICNGSETNSEERLSAELRMLTLHWKTEICQKISIVVYCIVSWCGLDSAGNFDFAKNISTYTSWWQCVSLCLARPICWSWYFPVVCVLASAYHLNFNERVLYSDLLCQCGVCVWIPVMCVCVCKNVSRLSVPPCTEQVS